jgi:hypothetical protein
MSERQQADTLPPESPHHGYRGERPARQEGFAPAGLTIAISREAGARGGTIGRRVGRKLGWQVYDQELLDYVVQEGTVQPGFAEGLSEAANRWVEEQIQALVAAGLEMPPPVVGITRATLALGAQGHVLLVGRGAGFLLPRETTLHVRLVAPLEERIAYMAQWLRLTVEEARQRVQVRDQRRADFLTTYLRRQPAEAHGYDLVLNTSTLGEEVCTELICQAARLKEAHFLVAGEEALP